MASRISVTVDVRDTSRRGIQSVRNQLRQLRDEAQHAGDDVDINVRVAPGDAERVRRQLRRVTAGLDDHVRIRTTITGPSRSDRNRFTRLLGNQLQGAGNTVGGLLSDGIGQGIADGFKSGGPAFAAAFVALIASTAAVVGAAVSGLVVVALGAAFTGVAAVSAFKSKEVQKQWQDTLGVLKKEFADVGTPLIPVLEHALGTLEKLSKKAAPALKQAVADTSGATQKFIDLIIKGFESFGKAAFKPIMDAWNVFAPVFGQEWNEFMDELGNSFKEMADLVKKHPTEIAMALDVVFEAIDLLVDAVTFFAKVWVQGMRAATFFVGSFGQAFTGVVDLILSGFEWTIKAAAQAFGWIPGIGDKLKNASKNFETFRDDVKQKLTDISNSALNYGLSLDKANKVRTLKANISTWQSQLSKARADLRKTSNQKAEAKLKANIHDLESKVARARSQLNSLNGKTAVTYIITHSDTYRSVHDIVGKATGGVIGGAATGGVRNNLTMVGEQGPELVELPVGSRVRSNADTRRLIGAGGGGGGGVGTLEIVADDPAMLELFRRVVRKAGGDFDVVFKRGRRS